MPSAENEPPPGPKAPEGSPPVIAHRDAWAVPVMWMVIVLIAVAAAVYIFKSCRDLPGETLDKAGQLVVKVGSKLEDVASAFNRGTVTTTFTSYATTLSGSQRLQIATLSQHETFTRKDESSTGFGYIPLPDVIVEASAPVTYTYYLDLNDKWDFLLKDGVIYVTAPAIKYNKPAVDVSRITWEVKKGGYFLRDEKAAMQNLKDSITWLSYRKAQTNIGLARDTARHQTESFVQNWLSRSFADGKSYPVKVRFRDETEGTPKPLVPKPD
jgi:hypothetical protein